VKLFKLLIASILVSPSFLFCGDTPFSSITPEKEYQTLLTIGSTTHSPLSEALQDLIEGIGQRYFDSLFFQKLSEAEKNHLEGEYLDHWPNGQLKIKAYFKNGKVDGHVHGWYEDGLDAFKLFFYEEKKVGVHLAFYPNAGNRRWARAVARVINYNLKGELDGEQFSNYYSGRAKLIIFYKKGRLEGHFGLYDDSRKSLKTERYKRGKLKEKLL